MTWARFDDAYLRNPKLIDQPFQVKYLDMAGTVWCASGMTDGRIPAMQLPAVDPSLPTPKKWAARLVKQGRWHSAQTIGDCETCSGLGIELSPGDHLIHDYLDYNPSREQLQEERRRDAERKRKARSGGVPSGHSPESPADVRPDSKRPVPEPVPEPREELASRGSQNGSTGGGGPGEGSPSDLLSWIELVPPGIEAGQARYLLGKCAMAATSWAEDLNHPASREVLVSEYVQRPGPFVEALQRADDLGPGTIDNPVGWLRSMVRKLGEEGG